MQVKKFEAKSMQEALNMVKAELGPDAVILMARDLNKGFGLLGEKSVEVTAAVSNKTLTAKKLAEAKLSARQKEKFGRASARTQRGFIQKATGDLQERQQRAKRARNLTKIRYIDIEDEGRGQVQYHDPLETENYEKRSKAVTRSHATKVSRLLEDIDKDYEFEEELTYEAPSAEQRIKSAAQKAFTAFEPQFGEQAFLSNSRDQDSNQQPKISDLQGEIKRLQKVIDRLNESPQPYMSYHPGAQYEIPYELSFIFEKLINLGFSESNAAELVKEAKELMPQEDRSKRPLVQAWVARSIYDKIDEQDQAQSKRIQVFLGPHGVGKTSSLVKYASHLVAREKKKVAIVTCDVHKIGAVEQLRIYSQILHAPFAVVRYPEDWQFLLKELEEIDFILVDTPGMQLQDMNELDFLKKILPKAQDQLQKHYVVSVSFRDQEAFQVAARYRAIDFDDVIFTDMEQSVQHGMIYNFLRKFKKPMHSFGTGVRVPEDFELATRRKYLEVLFKGSKFNLEEENDGAVQEKKA